MQRIYFGYVTCLSVLLCISNMQAADEATNDWTQFRGPTANGRVPAGELPVKWSEADNICWKIKLEGSGWSQPLIHQGKVYVLQVRGDGLKKPKEMSNAVTDLSTMLPVMNKPVKSELVWEILCFKLEDGTVAWREELTREKPTVPIHISNTYATETPVIKDGRLFIYNGITGKAFGYELTGKKLWEISLGTYSYESNFGPASSPICYADGVIIQCDNEKNSFVISLDQVTGKELWRINRTEKTSWSTPFIWQVAGVDQLVICGKENVTAYDPVTRSEIWEINKIPSSFTATPVAQNGQLFLGNNGPFSDGPLYGISGNAKGDITLSRVEKNNASILWSRKKSGPGFASPLVVEDLLYIAFDNKLFSYDIKTGEEVYRQRLPDGRAQVGCPLVDNRHLYFLDESGKTYVIKPGRTFELVSTNQLDDLFWATPAATKTQLILRGADHLYCVGK